MNHLFRGSLYIAWILLSPFGIIKFYAVFDNAWKNTIGCPTEQYATRMDGLFGIYLAVFIFGWGIWYISKMVAPPKERGIPKR